MFQLLEVQGGVFLRSWCSAPALGNICKLFKPSSKHIFIDLYRGVFMGKNIKVAYMQRVIHLLALWTEWFSAVFSLCSRPAGSHPSIALRYQSQLPGGWDRGCGSRSHWGGLLQRPAGVRAHLPAPPGRAVSPEPLRGAVRPGTDAGICERRLRHGHRQHLRAGSPSPLQHHRVGQKHPVLPGAPGFRAGQV